MHLLNQQTSEQYVTHMQKTSAVIKQWLDDNNVYLGGTPQQVQATNAFSIREKGRDIDTILADIQSKFLPSCVSTANANCLAHLHPPTLVIGQISEMIIAATNQSMDSWNQSPAATYIEKDLIHWLCQRCQLDSANNQTGSNAGGVFTSGGTQSNLMGLLLARNKFYKANVQKDGLMGQPVGNILCSDQAHFSIEKNAALLGLGQKSVIKIATDASGAMLMSDLQHQIDKLGADNVMAIIATAGTTDLGAIDPLMSIGKICRDEQIWLHVDAAWGGALLLSQRYRHLIEGLNQADSITLDFHKHFFLPISCGAFLLRDNQNFESIRHHSEYLNSADDEQDNILNLVTYSLQTTRRFDALKLWMALDLLGTDDYATLIDNCLDTAKQAAQLIDANENFVLVHEPIISSVLFYFTPKDTALSDDQLAQLNRHIAQALLINNIANVATTQFEQRLCLKFTILNPNTQINDIADIIEQMGIAGFNQLNSDNLNVDGKK
ncbi:pyridoxal phosphate-dependent decarboxylase family protein [Psychrobacter sp. SWN149]|uniref:pyridoxal phosphate-dependent decarboxylase family protein n=1 Tax=Psychrobacter sp. SWN149 TaxID=2792057 RepID=UPI0018CCFF13|nr:aspartate aminotransferase family protein [Psychrobacter sp. SWN149]MBH0006623.1 aspartate aminotransferase family protein [Psychrobacter sp. SWN149]